MDSTTKKVLAVGAAILAGVAVGVYTDPDLSRKVEHEARGLLPTPQKTTTLYRWQDAAGVVQISDRPPPAGIEYETVEYDPNANLIPRERFVGEE
jgi:hypothetical protein